jgi:hypothetical protein
VRSEMDRLLRAPHFVGSKRYPAFLRYIVEKELCGEGDSLKERTVGVDVFHRPLDYDTNGDSVVRFTAGEVRKRLELFYHESPELHPVHISLPVGSYVPRFHRAPGHVGAGGTRVWDTEPAVQAPEPARTIQKGHSLSRMQVSVLAVLVCLLSVGSLLLYRYKEARQPEMIPQFWEPLQVSGGPILLCTGTLAFTPSNPLSPMPATRDDNYTYMSFGTATALSDLTALFGQLRMKYVSQAAAQVNLTRLEAQPVVLIGAYTNAWTLQLTNNLRYRFKAPPNYQIFDATNPAIHWDGSRSSPYNVGTNDVGLVARYHDAITNNFVVVIAGLGINGTVAAADIVTKPQYQDLLNRSLPRGWEKKNVEVVLSSRVIQNEAAPPTILAVYTW